MPYVKNHSKTPFVVPNLAGGAGTMLTHRGFRSKNGVSEVGVADWTAFKKDWLGKLLIEEGKLSVTDEAPAPILAETSRRDRDDDGPRAA
ncbi:hypothetical protein VSR82_21760 [Burkholderia sp. JPY481]